MSQAATTVAKRPEISPIHTACRDCVFATRRQRTQVGCELDRLRKFAQEGAAILEAYDDSGGDFFVVSGRVCTAYRSPRWGQYVAPAARAAKVREEIRLPVEILVLL